MIYLDYHASAPLRAEAFAAMLPWLQTPGNPASAHAAGRKVRQALEDAREQIASLLGAIPDEVIFTSGATEANNLALFGLAGDPPACILASPIEHPCVIEPLQQLAKRGFAVEWLPISADGTLADSHDVMSRASQARLTTLMFANHETGAIQPVAKLAASAARLHTDAAQAAGKISVDFHRLGSTSLSISAHKFGGPVGIGALLIRRNANLRPLIFGGHQQWGKRPGTEPVALAVGMAAALAAAIGNHERERATTEHRRNRFLRYLQECAAPIVLNGSMQGLPHVLNLSFLGCRAEALLAALDLAGVACSTGSACSSGSLLPSPVLKAMNVGDERLRSAIRFSFGHSLSDVDVDEAARVVTRVVTRLRSVGVESDTASLV